MNRETVFSIAAQVDTECGQINGPGSEWLRAFADKVGWRKMETAPKDGRWILAINAATNATKPHVVKYSKKKSDEKYPWVRSDAPMGWVAGLTHWMPSPKPPTSLHKQ